MANTFTIGIGEMATARPPDIIRTVVGSCIAVVFFDKRQKLFGMAHIMMPSASGTANSPGKYADTAILQLLTEMRVPKAGAHRLQAKIAGGANMFADKFKEDFLKVGEKNRSAVVDILKALKIPVLGADYGGSVAREVWVDAGEYRVFSKKVGEEAREI